MLHYPALIDGKTGAFGVTFPDLPGIVAMGTTVEEAILNAEEALQDYMIETGVDGEDIVSPTPPGETKIPEGQQLVYIPRVAPDSQGAPVS